MRSTSSSSSLHYIPGLQVLQLVLLGAVALAGCSKDEPADTGMTNKTTTEAGASTGGSGGQSETSATTAAAPTSTGEMGTSGSTGEVMDTGCNFICNDQPMGNTECDNWAQDCPEGQKCMPYAEGSTAWNGTKCVDVKPEMGQHGDSCTVEGGGTSGIDTCAKGVMCWEVDPETLIGTCVAQCTGTQDAPVCNIADTSCFISNDGVLNLCLPLCDPLAQDCPGTSLCIPNPKNNEEFTCVLDASGEEGQTFDACEYINVCDKGLLCANPALASECNAGANGCCLPFCPLDEDPAMCPGVGQQCLPWFEVGTAPPGYENVGFCGIPM